MPGPNHRQRYETFLVQLRAARLRAGLTQTDIARRLDNTQTFISKCERGERRIDVVDLLDFLEAFGMPPADFVKELSEKLRPVSATARRTARTGRK